MSEFIKALINMDEKRALELVGKILKEEKGLQSILDGTREAMENIGGKFENKEYFLPELIMAGEMLSRITSVIKEKTEQEVISVSSIDEKKGRVLIGTVKGDIHDIGKNIVVFMLDVNGFAVKDIGVDVSPEQFVEAIREFNPQVVGMCGLLTLAYDSMKETIETIAKDGLRDQVKIMIGGSVMSEEVAKYVGADAYGETAMSAVSLSEKWIGGN